MQAPRPDAHWRDSARSPKFFIIDFRAVFPIFFWLLHIRWWTFFIAVGVTIFFAILHRYGFTLNVFGRWLRSFFAGKRRIAIPWWV